MFTGSVTTYEREEVFVPQKQEVSLKVNFKPLEGMIRDTFPEQPDRMVAIANCESGIRQFYDDGSIVRSHTNDVGVMQINIATWLDESIELGYDIEIPEDNILMARHIYDVQGIEAWVCNQKV